MAIVPYKIFFTKGVGRAKEKLQSFEYALRDAGIAPYNLVRVSSILPPKCKIVTKSQGIKELEHGQILFCVIAESAANEPNRLIVASIGMANPEKNDLYGYLSEHHACGQTEEVAGEYAEDLSAKMLASTLGIEYDEDVTYDAKSELWKMKGLKVRTRNITQSAVGSKKGLWTTVVAAAVLIN
jgi:arginine decarboxylase